METTHEKIVKILEAIKDGYPYEVRTFKTLGVTDDYSYIVVENPKYAPDNGEDPKLVIEVVNEFFSVG